MTHREEALRALRRDIGRVLNEINDDFEDFDDDIFI